MYQQQQKKKLYAKLPGFAKNAFLIIDLGGHSLEPWYSLLAAIFTCQTLKMRRHLLHSAARAELLPCR